MDYQMSAFSPCKQTHSWPCTFDAVDQLQDFSFHYAIRFCPVERIVTRGLPHSIIGDPGAVSRVGRKGGTKVFITVERAPGYRLSPDHFQKFKRMPAPDRAQKIIVPNQRTHLNEFFSCVRTWQLLSWSRLVQLMHQRNARRTRSGNFQFDIKSPSDPTRLLCQMQPYASSWREWILFLLVYVLHKTWN